MYDEIANPPDHENGTPVTGSVYGELSRALYSALQERPETFRTTWYIYRLYDTKTTMSWEFGDTYSEDTDPRLELVSPKTYQIDNKYFTLEQRKLVNIAWREWYKNNVTNFKDGQTLKRAKKALDRQKYWKTRMYCPRILVWLKELFLD